MQDQNSAEWPQEIYLKDTEYNIIQGYYQHKIYGKIFHETSQVENI